MPAAGWLDDSMTAKRCHRPSINIAAPVLHLTWRLFRALFASFGASLVDSIKIACHCCLASLLSVCGKQSAEQQASSSGLSLAGSGHGLGSLADMLSPLDIGGDVVVFWQNHYSSTTCIILSFG